MKKNYSGTNTDKVLLIVAVIAVAISIVGAGVTYNYLSSFKNRMTGFAVEGGWVNLTIESNVAINFTTEAINWSSGRVNDTATIAILDTSNQTALNVTGGTWVGNTRGLILENIGNKNVTLNFASSKTNETLLGTSSQSYFKWKFTSNSTNAPCVFANAGTINNTWRDANSSTDICTYFYYESDRDKIRIDFFLQIPYTATTGLKGATITATFAEAT